MNTPGEIASVDISSLMDGDYPEQTLSELRGAVEQDGFVCVTGHGIPRSLIRGCRARALSFFRQPESVKRNASVSQHHRGWLAVGGARMADDVLADMKESFIWGLDEDGAAVDHRLRGANRWPDDSDLRKHANAWFEAAAHLARILLQSFAVSYDHDPDYFLKTSDRPLSRASCVFYPSQQSHAGSPDQFGVGPHTDFGVLTILSQDLVGGLQVETGANEWLDVQPNQDALIVNIGDLLCRWSNGRMRSARHRVVRPKDNDRLSLVFAYDPNPETLIDPADFAPDLALEEVSEPTAITCGEYLDWRFSQAFAYRKTETAQ